MNKHTVINKISITLKIDNSTTEGLFIDTIDFSRIIQKNLLLVHFTSLLTNKFVRTFLSKMKLHSLLNTLERLRMTEGAGYLIKTDNCQLF